MSGEAALGTLAADGACQFTICQNEYIIGPELHKIGGMRREGDELGELAKPQQIRNTEKKIVNVVKANTPRLYREYETSRQNANTQHVK